jgi:O-antigen ligase
MNKIFVFVWLVIIGSNVANYYSQEAAYQGVVVVGGAAYFLLVFRKQLQRLLFFKDYFLVLSMLLAPIPLMLISDRTFARGAYTSNITVAIVFVVASVLASRAELVRTLAIAAFVIVAVGTAMNCYELFIENNVWSLSPGRSAGFYVNPNVSSQALAGYGLVFLLVRSTKFRFADLILMSLVAVGVFATFSRAGILAAMILLTVATAMRARRQQMPRIVAGVVTVTLLAGIFAFYVIHSLDLSSDASIRVFSLTERGGVGDYEEDRGGVALESFELFMQNPLFGLGVGVIAELEEGPHNMFVAMLVEYGVVGLVIYLGIILRLILIARRANRDLSGMVFLFLGWLVIFGLGSHNLLDDTDTMPLFGFALARAYQIQASRQSKQIDI